LDGIEPFAESRPLIVCDRDIQNGAATFRGTRILVHHIAALLAPGATEAELQEDYPRLTPEMLAAAPDYARAHLAGEQAATRTQPQGE
jgi:uncharacterized protein (DUF433 family)